MMGKFTKGPRYRANYSARSAATWKFLAHSDNNSVDESERMANAALIAASPEMYEMLKHVNSLIVSVKSPLYDDIEKLLAKHAIFRLSQALNHLREAAEFIEHPLRDDINELADELEFLKLEGLAE